MSQGFNHFDENGNAVMVDVSGKNVTYRTAVATGEIHVGEAIMEAVKEGSVKKGDVLGVARVAGIMGVKRTSELIPMCHPLPIQKCSVDYELDEINGIIRCFLYSENRRQDRCGNGGTDRGSGDASDDLRYV